MPEPFFVMNTRTTMRLITLVDIKNMSGEAKVEALISFIELERERLAHQPNQLIRSQALSAAERMLRNIVVPPSANAEACRNLFP